LMSHEEHTHSHDYSLEEINHQLYHQQYPEEDNFEQLDSHSESHSDDENGEEAEMKHFMEVIQSFACYKRFSMLRLNRAKKNVSMLSQHHLSLIPDREERFQRWEDAIHHNTLFLDEMISNDQIFENQQLRYPDLKDQAIASSFNMEKVLSTVRQFAREWSIDGKLERDTSYGLILEELERSFPINEENFAKIKVLCPGSGLGRLPFEICRRGYSSQGNEFSYFMLIPGNYILNRVSKENSITIYPYVHQISNIIQNEDQFRTVTIPDINPTSLPQGSDFSYTAGDFIEVYASQLDTWDAICTCFFLDTAKNIIQYIEVIFNILKPGGKWINLGPLLYHYSDLPKEQSIELTYEQIKNVVKGIGFILENETFQETFYTHNSKSMMKIAYNCILFSAQKPK